MSDRDEYKRAVGSEHHEPPPPYQAPTTSPLGILLIALSWVACAVIVGWILFKLLGG